MTIGERLDALKGIGPGFDHLRIGLSLSILLWHSFSISYGQNYASTLPTFPVPPLLGGLLPMFFALSGFLVMGSAIRTADLKTFVTFRVLRILPALFTEITVSALVLGPLMTALPLRQYFTDPRFAEYFGSLIGRVRFVLPGLFLDNPAPELVNFALWTVGPEILCYVIMSILILTGIYRRSGMMLAVAGGFTLVALVAGFAYPPPKVAEVLPAKLLILSFIVGNLLYLYRDRIPFSRPLAAIAFVVALLLIFATQRLDIALPAYGALPLLAYAIVVVGLSRLPQMPFFHRGDYSYGVYIYGFPIQQAVTHFAPLHLRQWWFNFAISLPLVLICAVTSWHMVEKPFLNLRKRILTRRDLAAAPAPGGRRRRAIILAGLAAYGVFVTDASKVLPLRPFAKSALHSVGIYTYPEGSPQTL